MRTVLKWLMIVLGAACLLIGLGHVAGGIHSEPGLSGAGPTVDSRERFFGAIFAFYGVACLASVRGTIDAKQVNWLAGFFLLGGLGRLLSWALEGRPHWFQLPLTALELIVPLIIFGLVRGLDRTKE